MVITNDREKLLAEIDRRASYVRELYERELQAKKDENLELAESLKHQRIVEERGYGVAYRRYVSNRPLVVDVNNHELRERQRATA